MYDEAATALMGMTASDFNGLNKTNKDKAALFVLDKPMRVLMYTHNKPTPFPKYTIKTAAFENEQTI